MKSRGWQVLKANQNRGVTMAVILCTGAFFLAFAAAILYAAGVMTAQSTERLKQERCYQLARTGAAVIDQELTRADYTDKNSERLNNTLYRFANQFLDRSEYSDYDEDDDSGRTQYNYILSGSDLKNLSKNVAGDGFGNLSITLRKQKTSENDLSTLSGDIQVNTGNYSEQIKNIRDTAVRQYSLSVDVTAYYEDAQYTYTTEYVRAETFEPVFTYNNQTIVWDNNQWKQENTSGSTVDFSSGGEIHYSYNANKTTSSRFENTQDKGGN